MTHSILNVSKRVIVVLATMAYFQDEFTHNVGISLAILVLGFVLYEMKLERICQVQNQVSGTTEKAVNINEKSVIVK